MAISGAINFIILLTHTAATAAANLECVARARLLQQIPQIRCDLRNGHTKEQMPDRETRRNVSHTVLLQVTKATVAADKDC